MMAKNNWLNVRLSDLIQGFCSTNSIPPPSIINQQIHRYSYRQCAIVLLSLFSLIQASCGGGGESTPSAMRTVEVSWDANRETAVNSTGGGYRVYYSMRSGFTLDDAGVSEIDVPYAAPPLAPTSIKVELQSGQYYFRVVAYSDLNSPWGSIGGSVSAPSREIVLLVP